MARVSQRMTVVGVLWSCRVFRQNVEKDGISVRMTLLAVPVGATPDLR